MNRLLNSMAASLIFFTRLPLHRFVMPPKEVYTTVLSWIAFAGLVVGLFLAAAFWLASMVFPVGLAVVLVLAFGVLFTGALHEDGWADFIDGFGGGFTKDRILSIMKDSRIGTYGVVGLVLLFMVRYFALTSMPVGSIAPTLITGAVVGRFWGALLPSLLPYARPVQDSKVQMSQQPMSKPAIAVSALLSCALGYYFFGIGGILAFCAVGCLLPAAVLFLKRKIDGYTGDCCGMLITATELAWYLAVVIVLQFAVL